MTICKQLAQLMGATLEVQSAPGEGSTFALTLSLPVDSIAPTKLIAASSRQRARHDADRKVDEQAFYGEFAGGQAARLLVVEDNGINRRVVQLMLEKQGCRVDLAGNGLEALRLLDQTTYDLILMDCQMPEMDGYEATRRIRAREQGERHTPIIALTANTMEGDRERCLAAGMDDFLAKPFAQCDLRDLLANFLTCPVPALTLEVEEAPQNLNGTRNSLLAALTARIGDNPEHLQEFFQLFQDETSCLLVACHEAVQQNEGEALRRAAHGLKGILMTLDAGRDSAQAIELARLLELHGKTQGVPDALHLLTSLEAKLRYITTYLYSCIFPAANAVCAKEDTLEGEKGAS